jgi:hypothetical protein
VSATIPVVVFVAMHLLARRSPAAFWGADSLAYYGPLVTAAFVAIPLAALLLPLPVAPDALRRLASRTAASWWFPWGLSLAVLPLLWYGRVRVHALGDSVKWFAVVGNAVEHYRPFAEIPWHNASLNLPGLEFINFQQAFDLLVHVGVYALLHAFGGNDPQVAYEWVSIISGGLYLPVLWSLARRLSVSPAERFAVFAFFLSLGTLQLFCGYGESYTLVTLLCAIYLTFAIDALRGSRPLWQAGAILGLAGATHMLALSLVPSLLLVAWYCPWGETTLRRWQIYLPVVAIGMLASLFAYLGFYQSLHLPLFTPDHPGRYALLSMRHAAALGNACC